MATKSIKSYFDSIAELVDFNFYYLILIKYKKILLIIPLLVVGLAYLITLNLEPIYQSSATLVICWRRWNTRSLVDINLGATHNEVRYIKRSAVAWK